MSKYRIVNRNGTCVWEGEACSYYEAWEHMFKSCKYPTEFQVISKAINMGMWIEKDKDDGDNRTV